MLQGDDLFTDDAYRRLLPNSAFAQGRSSQIRSPTLNDVIKVYLGAQAPLVTCGARGI
jgi:hypothetical protein